jgi:L-fucose mutarotase
MLIGISPLIGPDLLRTLRAMGHGDEIALVDANYPAEEHGRRVLRADGVGMVALLSAILPLLPLDAGEPAILRAALGNAPPACGPIHEAIDALCARLAPGRAVQALAGHDLYPRIRAAHAVVATGERATFANVILRKGVIEAEAGG